MRNVRHLPARWEEEEARTWGSLEITGDFAEPPLVDPFRAAGLGESAAVLRANIAGSGPKLSAGSALGVAEPPETTTVWPALLEATPAAGWARARRGARVARELQELPLEARRVGKGWRSANGSDGRPSRSGKAAAAAAGAPAQRVVLLRAAGGMRRGAGAGCGTGSGSGSGSKFRPGSGSAAGSGSGMGSAFGSGFRGASASAGGAASLRATAAGVGATPASASAIGAAASSGGVPSSVSAPAPPAVGSGAAPSRGAAASAQLLVLLNALGPKCAPPASAAGVSSGWSFKMTSGSAARARRGHVPALLRCVHWQ